MNLNEIQCFSKVAQLGSFSAAAKQMNMPKSSLSRRVAALEQRLGVTLLRRTTRKIQLTEAGAQYFQVCQRALQDLEAAESRVASGQTLAQGKLRIAAPIDIGSTFLAELAIHFCAQHPEVELDFLLDDAVIDLVDQKVDIAIRAGTLPDSSLVGFKLGVSEFQLFSSPAYLKKYGEPKSPKDLKDHRCLLFPPITLGDDTWELQSDGTRQKVRLSKVTRVSHLSMIKTLAIHGAGIALLPSFRGFEEVDSRQLVRILPQWSSERSPVHAVYVKQPYLPHRTRLFFDFLKKNLKLEK